MVCARSGDARRGEGRGGAGQAAQRLEAGRGRAEVACGEESGGREEPGRREGLGLWVLPEGFWSLKWWGFPSRRRGGRGRGVREGCAVAVVW